jgi:hypothetical protein
MNNIIHPKWIIFFSFFFWGILAIIPTYSLYGADKSYPLIFLLFIIYLMTKNLKNPTDYNFKISKLFIAFVLFYVFFQIFFNNALPFFNTVDSVVSDFNKTEGYGRSASSLLDTILSFAPFVILASDLKKTHRYLLYFVVIIPFIGISRGLLFFYLTVFFFAEIKFNFFKWSIIVFSIYLTISWVSVLRDGVDSGYNANPFIDSFLAPVINFTLLYQKDPTTFTSFEYFTQIIQKPIPSFIIDKNIISTNLIYTRDLYDKVETISVFTYLPEIYFFGKNPFIQSFLVSIYFYVIVKVINTVTKRSKYFYYAFALLFVILLRSRFLDVISFSLAMIICFYLNKFLCVFELSFKNNSIKR